MDILKDIKTIGSGHFERIECAQRRPQLSIFFSYLRERKKDGRLNSNSLQSYNVYKQNIILFSELRQQTLLFIYFFIHT